MSVAARNETILEMFDGIRGMVYNFARKFNLEFDDVLQDSALIMLEVYPRIPVDCMNVRAYLCGAVRRELYQRLRRRGQETLSLDTPIAPNTTETFADMLEAFVEQDSKRSEHVTKTVHTAMHNLSLEVQLHTRDFYKLGSYDPVLPRTSRKVAYGRRQEHMRASLKRSFRKDAQVLALMH
jgi:DNA-directed RNA polymerase specialized sigma24 family protein